MADKLACVVFSGTADKLQAAATIISGAAAMEMETHVFVAFWGVNAFRKDTIDEPAPVSPEYGELSTAVAKLMVDKNVQPWQQIMRTAKEIGDVHIHACSATIDLLDLTQDDLDPIVDDIIGIASFLQLAEGAQTLFI